MFTSTLGVQPSVAALSAVGLGYERARARWPSIDVSPDRLVDSLARVVEGDDDPGGSVERLIIEDLYLVCACVRGETVGHPLFEREFVPVAERALRRAGSGDVEADLQTFRIHVLIGRDGNPRLERYSGRGRLGSWVRIVARRLAEPRRAAPESLPDEVGGQWLGDDELDPELAFLRRTHHEAFVAGLHRAFAALSPRTRTILRYRYLDGLEVSAIARLLDLHRGSASRLLGQARRELRENLRADLVAHARLSNSEAESLTRLLKSTLDVSLQGLLQPSGPA